MKMKLNEINKIFKIIDDSKNICIAGHKSPDGDCIGSVMALYKLLDTWNKNVTICLDGNIPFNYKSLINEKIISKDCCDLQYDVLIMLDCSDAKRLGKFENIINKADITVCIDHHKTNEKFADINIIAPDISSTGELLYNIFKSAGKHITKEIAEYLYIAIVTDTGKFSYSNTSSQTHRNVAELIDLGVDVAAFDNILYNSKPSNVVKAYIECISSIELHYDNRFGLANIAQDVLSRNDVEMNDIDGVVEFIRGIKEVEVSCVLKEHENSTKVSLRSKNDIDVSAICLKYGGGGHSKAAGFDFEDSLENTKKILLEEFKKYFGEK